MPTKDQLRSIEWAGKVAGAKACPACGWGWCDPGKHAPDCWLAAALATPDTLPPVAVADHPDIPALVARLETMIRHLRDGLRHDTPDPDEKLLFTGIVVLYEDAAAALSRLSREVAIEREAGVDARNSLRLADAAVDDLKARLATAERERDEARAALARYEADHAKRRP